MGDPNPYWNIQGKGKPTKWWSVQGGKQVGMETMAEDYGNPLQYHVPMETRAEMQNPAGSQIHHNWTGEYPQPSWTQWQQAPQKGKPCGAYQPGNEWNEGSRTENAGGPQIGGKMQNKWAGGLENIQGYRQIDPVEWMPQIPAQQQPGTQPTAYAYMVQPWETKGKDGNWMGNPPRETNQEIEQQWNPQKGQSKAMGKKMVNQPLPREKIERRQQQKQREMEKISSEVEDTSHKRHSNIVESSHYD